MEYITTKNNNLEGEINIYRKNNKTITVFTKCSIETIENHLIFLKQITLQSIMKLNKYNENVSDDCGRIFNQIWEKIIQTNDDCFTPDNITINVIIEFELNPLKIIYRLLTYNKSKNYKFIQLL